MPVVGCQLKVLPRIEQPAIMLPQPFTPRAKLDLIPLGPELSQIVGPANTLLLIELPENTIRSNGGKIAAIRGNGERVVDRRALEIGCHAIKTSQQEQRARDFEQTKTAVGTVLQVTVESRECRVTISHL